MENTIKSNLILPTNYYELDREEMSYVEGGGTLNISVTISCTFGGLIEGLLSGVITSLVTGLTGGLGAIVAAIVGPIINKLLGNIISSTINNALGDLSGVSVCCFNISKSGWLIPNITKNFDIDLAEIIGSAFGGGLTNSGCAQTINNTSVSLAYSN